MFYRYFLMTPNGLLHVTIALYGIHPATDAVIFKLFEQTSFYLGIQAVPRPFYLIEAFDRNRCIFLCIGLYRCGQLFIVLPS
jgi:hypothetical protein